jgi:2-keto-4-pentenoate hydratase/2-oxohepta-3-ene-1,7-dioic acid hydratase in catechol pathway
MDPLPHLVWTECPPHPRLPVGKILCGGRNYAAHAREMGAESPAEPILFLKPPTALQQDDPLIRIPAFTAELHHEVELVVRIARLLKCATPAEADTAIDAYAVGLDLTARDVQVRAKEKGLPWTVAKGFDGAAPISPLRPAERCSDLAALDLTLRLDGALRQQGNTRRMIFSVAELLSYASTIFTMVPGDLVFTGTPEGVGPLLPGQSFEATLGTELRWAGRVASR